MSLAAASILYKIVGKKMSKFFRTIALASTVACLPFATQAAPVTLDFEGLVTANTAVQLDAQYSGQGITFVVDLPNSTQALAYNGAAASNRPANGALGSLGFARNGLQKSITIDVRSGFTFDVLSFYSLSTSNFDVTIFGRNGDATQPLTITKQTAWTDAWKFQDLKNNNVYPDVGAIDRITFTSAGVFALDNITFSLSTDTGGGNVPEPAGFGLVALALAAAGFASRRRKPA